MAGVRKPRTQAVAGRNEMHEFATKQATETSTSNQKLVRLQDR